ncbi:MAG: ABC transporter ATP-binding protein [Burkholderiaceae bacterium]|jgi:iron complex transport system ATP-binding protein|nr:ABC transporter ATP-binding protein [Burkholderiaceae bacterium]
MLHIRNLDLMAGKKTLIRQLDCAIAPGECWAVFGKNGAGKTTLLRTLAGLRPADAGEVLLCGKPLSAWGNISLARQRAWLPQARHDAFAYSVLETVLAGRHPWHEGHYWENHRDMAAAFSAMRQLDLLPLKDRDIRTLSGGERQRVALAAILAQDTPLVLLDEPAVSLDLAHQAALMRLVGQLCRERQKSVVMVAHDLNLVHDIATHALLINGDGEWYAGTADTVMNADRLSRCLGHPVMALSHEGRAVFVAAA